MCGIAGIFSIDGGKPPSEQEISAMVTALHHRGPDSQGIFLDATIALGHARLSIVDLATGQQPIHNEDGSIQVVFNGEIFNHRALRHALEKCGHRFYTHSDTEVIVHLYEEHGERFVDHLNGQFAIALWDNARKTLVLARDRTGIRPLFYAATASRLVFASEIKALFMLPEVPRKIDTQALAEICTYWSPLAPKSIFSDVHSLPPGHIMTIKEGKRNFRRYWDWSFPARGTRVFRHEEECLEELSELLSDAVKMQLQADVPVGAYLSGGLDSAIVAALARNLGGTQLRTFSLTFEDAEFDESKHQEEMANFLGTHHSSLRCNRTDIAMAFPKTIWHVESPIVRTAPTPLMLLSAHVREAGYKVVLTGEGADEVFGGYDIFKEAKIRRFWAKAPESTMRPRILERLYPYLKHSPASSQAFTRAFFSEGMEHTHQPYFAHMPRWTTTSRIGRFFSEEMRTSLGGWDPYSALLATLPEEMAHWDPMGKDQYVEAHTLMSGYLLCSQGDRVAMANSIEGRFPFLDHRLIEFANQLPPTMKLHGLTEKYLLKKVSADWIPKSVRARTKQPYRAPDSQSFFFEGKAIDYVDDLLSPEKIKAAGYFDPVAVGKLMEKCRKGRVVGFADNMAFVAILSTMLVHEQFILGHRMN